MRERKLNDTSRMWQHKHNNTARQQDGPASPRRSKLARGEAAALLLAVLFVISLFLAGAIALGLRLWAPDRISVNRAPPNDEASARPNGDTGARRRLVDMRSRIWLANRR